MYLGPNEEVPTKNGDPKVTEEVLLVSKWNKHVATAWRCIVDDE